MHLSFLGSQTLNKPSALPLKKRIKPFALEGKSNSASKLAMISCDPDMNNTQALEEIKSGALKMEKIYLLLCKMKLEISRSQMSQ